MQFCCRDDLFSMDGDHPLGKDAVERVFFQEVDRRGAETTHKIIERGVRGLTSAERTAFVSFLLSLDARRPGNVRLLRERGAEYYRKGLDEDPKILEAFRKAGETGRPSELYERINGRTLADTAMLSVQSLTTNPRVGRLLINFNWAVRTLNDADGTFVLGDRPLVRYNPIDDSNALWALPLTPKVMWLATPNVDTVRKFLRSSSKRVRIYMNDSSASQCDRYVFSIEQVGLGWLERRLQLRVASGPEIVEGSKLL